MGEGEGGVTRKTRRIQKTRRMNVNANVKRQKILCVETPGLSAFNREKQNICAIVIRKEKHIEAMK